MGTKEEGEGDDGWEKRKEGEKKRERKGRGREGGQGVGRDRDGICIPQSTSLKGSLYVSVLDLWLMFPYSCLLGY